MKKTIIAVVVIIVLGLIVWGVTKNPVKTPVVEPVVQKEPIKIGAVLSLTSFAAPWGEYAKNAIDLAVKNINDNGGIEGRKVEVLVGDDHTDAKDAVTAYQKLVNVDKVQGIIGGVFDFTAQPLISLSSTTQITFISGSNFRIPGGFDLNDQSFVMLPEFSVVIRQLKSYLADTQVKKLAVVHFKSVFGNEIAKTLDAVMKENNQGGIIDESYTKIGGNDFRTLIAKLKSQKVDTVFLDMVGDDPLNFLTQAKQLGFKPTIISYNGITDAFANESDKSLLEGVVVLNWEVPGPQFAQMYKNAYQKDATKSADKYFDAVYVLSQGIAHSSDPAEVATYITNNPITTPNSTVTFTPEHAAKSIIVQVNIIKDGVQIPYVK